MYLVCYIVCMHVCMVTIEDTSNVIMQLLYHIMYICIVTL